MATSEVRSSHRQAVGPGRAQLWLAIAALLAVTGLGSYLYTAYTPKQVTIVIDGEEALVLDVVARTVGQALQRAGISLREGDEVWPALYQALVDGTR
ncbi:MAG: ubiquitin-like domain-containing protein, partial [Clostridia bacterium]